MRYVCKKHEIGSAFVVTPYAMDVRNTKLDQSTLLHMYFAQHPHRHVEGME